MIAPSGARAHRRPHAGGLLFNLELEALARVREECPAVQLMIPFVRTRWELEACLELVARSPLGRQRGLERWVMAEVPSVAYRIPEYAALGIDGVSIGSNDLIQLMLGVDRGSSSTMTAARPTTTPGCTYPRWARSRRGTSSSGRRRTVAIPKCAAPHVARRRGRRRGSRTLRDPRRGDGGRAPRAADRDLRR